MYIHRELIDIDHTKPIDDQCQDILTNWEIVCEENDFHKDYVSQRDWDQWVEYRKGVDEDLVKLSTEPVGKIFNYLVPLNTRINNADRRDVKAEWEENHKKTLEQEAKELALLQEKQEKEAKPSHGLLSKMLKWR